MHNRRQFLALTGLIALMGCAPDVPPRYDYLATPTPVPSSLPGTPSLPSPSSTPSGSVVGAWGDVNVKTLATHTLIEADNFIMDLPGTWEPIVGLTEAELQGARYFVALGNPATALTVAVTCYRDTISPLAAMEQIADNTEAAGDSVTRLPGQQTRFGKTPALRAVIDDRMIEMRLFDTITELITVRVSAPNSPSAIIDIDEIMNTWVKRLT